MLKLNFIGDIDGLLCGIRELEADYGYIVADDGIAVAVTRSADSDLSVEFSDGRAEIVYDKPIHFFRALGHLVERLSASDVDFNVTETPRFAMNGPMFDVSQGCSVINIPEVKRIIRVMAVMGLPTLMLYCEDSYDVENQPYFGYMRSRYSEADMRELDDYAFAFGIEMIPCIQTLAHLTDALRWDVYRDIKEQPHCLLVGEDATYAFIRDLITSASRPFRSKRIHIGMDEAAGLGRGRYMDKHGARHSSEIMLDHLDRVLAITRELGLSPMMWSDMFFSTPTSTGSYDPSIEFSEEFLAKMPRDVGLIYWNYGMANVERYEMMLNKHRELGEPIFAGGIHNWYGFGLHYRTTFRSTNAALTACKKNGVKEVFATTWGDFGTECSIQGTMLGLALFAEHGYRDEVDEATLRRRFEFCADGDYDDFMLLDKVDEIPSIKVGYDGNCSKQLMWQDVLCGLLDKNYECVPISEHYTKLADEFETAAQSGRYSGMFSYYHHVAKVLALKGDMGIRLTAAYKSGDRDTLRRIAYEDLPELRRRVEALRAAHRRHWVEIYKSLGWEIFDMRYGALLVRLSTAVETVRDYLDGKVDSIAELDEPRLLYNGQEGIYYWNRYTSIAASPRTPFGV